MRHLISSLLIATLMAAGCAGEDGGDGDKGDPGAPGDDGTDGDPGPVGPSGQDGADGPQGPPGQDGVDAIDPRAPLSGMVALSFRDDHGTGATNFADYAKALAHQYATGALPATVQFPLANAATDSVRAIAGTHANLVVSWLDPMTFSDSIDAPVFGANADYVAFFGDGWDAVPGAAPNFAGSEFSGWVWVNHEYVSNAMPTATTGPLGQHRTLAGWLRYHGIIDANMEIGFGPSELTTYNHYYKRQLGGSWFRVIQDPATGEWLVDQSAGNMRYDATSDTLTRITGTAVLAADHTDDGDPLPMGVASGIAGDCSGAVTPWGTIITAEENVQDYYGDLEPAWTSNQKFIPGMGFDPGAAISPEYTPSDMSEMGSDPEPNARHNRDLYGYLVEIDPGADPGEYYGKTAAGVGHRKLGAMGRARWENATFVTGADWTLVPGQPIVVYAADDRRGGRIFKFVSSQPYTAGMSRAAIRALLDDGDLYVAHFAGLDNATGDTLLGGGAPTEAAPGTGQWIHLSTTSTDVAPNAGALGLAGTTVGVALQDNTYNGIGGFPTDDHVRRAMFTALAKIGVMELNRPEDLEWNPLDPSGTPRLYVAFTKHGRKTQLDQDGVLYDSATHDTTSPTRPDRTGSIFVIEEADPTNPGGSTTFDYFQVWHGTEGTGPFDVANPDNIMIDADGGVWFGTDGNLGTNGTNDAIYYLDLDPAHRAGQPGVTTPTFGLPFRVVAAPSDAEATGPAFTPGMGTMFFNVQHPGEDVISQWPRR